MSKKTPPLDNFLHEIEKNFVSIKDSQQPFAVFKSVFEQVHEKLKQVDNYYSRYASKIQYAGSFYDGVKVGTLDEFDMDVVIRLPIDPNEIIIENEQPGFVKLKIGAPFDNLDKQPCWESHHKVTRDWRDSEKYFLQSQFRSWIESAVTKAINELDRKVTVEGVTYNLTCKKSGPAFTLNVKNVELKFEVDVDLVPVILFRPPRWPEGYRKIMCEGDDNKNTWLVVPKPNKSIEDPSLQNRCWRLAFHDQEKEFIKGCKNLKPTLRLLKKLRDSLGMKAIASYYIKTLFLREIDSPGHDKKYWENKMSVLFKDMVQKFCLALEAKNIPYFWNDGYNLIGGLSDTLANQYQGKLKKLLTHIEDNAIVEIVKCLLKNEEFEKFRTTEIYKNYCVETAPASTKVVKKSASALTLASSSAIPELKDTKVVSSPITKEKDSAILSMLQKILSTNEKMEKTLSGMRDQIYSLQDKVEKLECAMKHSKEFNHGGLLPSIPLAAATVNHGLLKPERTLSSDLELLCFSPAVEQADLLKGFLDEPNSLLH